METREELLNGLNDAVNLLRQFVNDEQQLNKIRNQYRKIIPNLSSIINFLSFFLNKDLSSLLLKRMP